MYVHTYKRESYIQKKNEENFLSINKVEIIIKHKEK